MAIVMIRKSIIFFFSLLVRKNKPVGRQVFY